MTYFLLLTIVVLASCLVSLWAANRMLVADDERMRFELHEWMDQHYKLQIKHDALTVEVLESRHLVSDQTCLEVDTDVDF